VFEGRADFVFVSHVVELRHGVFSFCEIACSTYAIRPR
jgi:hypothetical protein